MPEVLESAVPEVSAETAVETVETPQSVESTISSSEENLGENQDGKQPIETDAVEGDGRQMPAKFKQYLKELQQSDPRLAKQIRAQWFFADQIRQSYPGGLKDIQKVAQIAEKIGGEEGIAAIEAERAEWADVDQAFESGDPSFVEKLSKESPEAFLKHVPLAINQFAKIDPEGYSHLMAGVIVKTIDESPLNAAYQLLSSGDEKAKELASQIARWYMDLDKMSKQKPIRQVDPREEALKQKEREFEERQAQEYHQSVTNEMRQFNTRQISSDLNAQLTKIGRNAEAFRKQNPESYDILMRNCNEAIQAILGKDEAFTQQHKTLLMSGDKSRVLQFTQAKIRQVSPEAVKRTLRAFLAFGGTPKTAPNPNGNGTPLAKTMEVQLSKIPKDSEIDKSRMGSDYVKMVMAGKVFLRGRKEMFRLP